MNLPGNNPYQFQGNIAFVTGGTSGIGKLSVEALARAGALVVFVGRRKDLGEDQAKELRAAGYMVEFLSCDVTQEEQVQKAVQQCVERHGAIHIAVNNAGVEGNPRELAALGLDEFQEVMDVNVTGTFLCMKYVIPALRQAGGGSLVNIASVLGELGMEGLAPYVASKHAVIGLTKTAALEEAQSGVRVNAVSPGAVNTDMLWRTMKDSEEAFREISSLHPMGRVATPEEIAEAVLWLSSDASRFVTGQVIKVDGGFSAR